MAQQDDNIKKLYDELQSTYDVGSEDDFRNYLNNAEHRKALYNELKNDYDIQDEKAFDDYLGYGNEGKAQGTTKVGSAAQQVVNEYDQSVRDNANNNNQSAPEDLSAATAGAKIGGNISLTPAKPNNQQTAQPVVDNTAKSVMDASGTPVEQAKATGPKTQFVPEDPNYVQATPTAEALKKYPWMQPDQVYLWNKTTKEPVVSYFDENGQAVTDEDLQIKKAKSEITGQEDTEYMHPEAAALQLPNGNTPGVRLKKGALTQMADEIMRKEYGDNYLNTQFGRDGNVYTGAERRDLGAQQLYDELNSDVRKARISFAVSDEKDRNEILSRIKAKWGKVADENSLVNAVNDENAAKQDIDIVAQQNINALNAEIQNISRQMDQRGAEIDNASSPFVDQTFNARDVDAKYRLLQSKLNYAQNALKSWENVKNSGSLDALAGFKDAVMDISAWDFGFSDLKNAVSLLTAKGKDKQELVNLYGRSAEAAKFEDKYNPDSYRYGKIAGASIPFALQFVGTGGGFKSIGSAVSKKATSIAEKYALEGLKKQVVKGLGVAVGDIARAYTMSGTVQGLNTISDILNRSAGELTVDKQGNYQLKSDEPLLKSIYKGVTASAIENYTEMLGERLNIGGNLMRMLPKIGLGRVSNAITKIGTQDWYKVCNNWLSRAGVNDFGGEVLEEEIGIVLNAALVGDNPLLNGNGGLLDLRTQKDILGGMLLSISSMRAGALAMYGVKKGVGSAFVKTLDMYDKMQLNQSDKGGQSIFGEGWTEIKDEIDNTPNDKVNSVIEKLAKEHPSKDEQSAIIDYAVKLLKTRGHNLGISMASDGENDEGAQEEVKDMPDLSQPNAEYLNKDDGMIHKASLYPDASDPTGTAKDVFIIKGNLVTNEDGSINKDASDKTIIYIDGNGERHIASPDKFAAAYPPISNNEVQQANEGGGNEEAQTTGNYNKGDEVNINVNGINYTAIIQDKDGFDNYNVYYEDENGMMHPAKFTADQLNDMNGKSTVSNGQQATSEQPVGVQQQVAQQVVEQPAQQEQETQQAQQAQEEQKPAIPTDEKGNTLYHQVPIETTINDLYDGKLDDNEIKDFVDANINEADKQLEKINKKAPKIGTNKNEYLKKKQEWQKQVEDATRIRDYWNSVKDYIAKQTHTTPEEIQAAQEELSGETAKREYQGMAENIQQDPISVASDFIRGAKITPESFKAETGYGAEEQRKFVGMIAKAENGGKSIDRLAEELVSYDNAEMNGSLFGGDTSSAKDAILSALQGAGTRGELKQTNEAEEQAYVDARNAARDAQYMEQYGMTYEEYLAYEEQIMPTIWREYNNYDETAFNNMYAEEIQQLLKSRENDTTGEKPTDDRGNQVLPEQQANEQPGSEGSTEPGREIQAGVQSTDENAVAPEEAQQEVGVTERRIEEKPYATVESKGGYVNLHRERYLKDGITYTHAVAIRNGKVVNMPTALFPIPKYMEILDVPEGVSVLGINELREDSKGNSAATVVVRYEDGGTGKMDVRLQPVVAQKIANAEAETDTNPTDGQKEAGNYKKGHVRIDGYDISIEQPKGSVRRGTDANGKQWEQKMNNTYGYIRGTEGVDGDHIDIFLSDNPTEGNVYVVDQVNPDGSFDEHKVMYGFHSADEARAAYLSNYEKGWKGLGSITEVSKEEFKKWVNSSKRKTKPFFEYKSVNAIGAQNEERVDVSPVIDNFSRDLTNNNGDNIRIKGYDGAKQIATVVINGEEQSISAKDVAENLNKGKWFEEKQEEKSEKPAMQKVNVEGLFNDLNKKGETKLSDNFVPVDEDKTQEKAVKPASQTDYEQIERDNFDKTYQKINDSIQGNIPNIPNIKKRIRELKKAISILENGTATVVSNDKEFDDAQRRIYALTGELKAWQKALKEINDKLKKSGETIVSDNKKPVENKSAKENKTEYGANNKVVSKERYEELKKRMIKKLGQLNFGMDPELIEIGVEMTAYHLEAGARKFADYAKAMINDVGDVIRPYLKSLYNAARDYPDVVEAGLNVGMSTGDEVSKFDVMNFDKNTVDALATADNVVKEQNIKKETEKIIKENEQKDEQTAANTEAIASETETVASDAERRIEEAKTPEEVDDAVKNADKHLQTIDNQLSELNYIDNLHSGARVVLKDGRNVLLTIVMHEGEQISATEMSKPRIGRLYGSYKGQLIDFMPDDIDVDSSIKLNKNEVDNSESKETSKKLTEYNGFKVGDKVIYSPNGGIGKSEEATIYDFELYGDHKPVLDTGLAPVLYEVAEWDDIKPYKENKSTTKVGKTRKKSVSSQKIADLFGDINKSTKSDAQRKFSDIVKSDMLSALDSGEKPYRSIVDLRKRAVDAGMDVDNEGRSDILLQELVEDGLVGAAREVVSKYGNDSKESYDLICKLYDMQPTIAARSSNRIKMQQYSTPLPMAWNAAHFAMSGKQDGKVLEPTAGNGMLVFAVPANQVHANELDETRLNNLREQGFAKVTQQDATEPFEGGKQYDVIIANPPFGSRKAVDYDGKMIPGLDPQITLNALSSMKDDGKAAIIIGGNMEYAKNGSIKSMKPFFTYLYDHYNVKGVIDMDGKLFSKQGTTFPTRMILIDGRRSEEDRAQTTVYPPVESKAIAKVNNFEELYNTVNEIINSKEKTNGTEILHSRERELIPDNNRPSGNAERIRHSEQHRKDDAGGRGNKSEGGKNQSERVLPGERRKDTGNGGVRSETTGSEPGRSRGNNESDVQRVDGMGISTDRVGLKEEPKKRTLTEEKLPYRPHNTAFSLNSVAPSAMVEAMDKILTQIEKENGNIDEFVRKELGYDTIEEAHQALAAEQMDSVAMAIYQMKKGQALIIGDQTGVGKGRQMAALIRWAVKRGEKPIFFTQKADLFSDIYRDLVDVGSGDLVPFIFNSPSAKENKGEMVDANGNVVYKGLTDAKMKKVMATGKLPENCDYAVLTYSQVNTGDDISQKEMQEAAKKNGTRVKKSKSSKEGKPTPKATFLRAIAKDNYLFLDESHTAAGSSNTGAYLQSILKSAKAATFASATFAKRPDTMPLYAIRTAMSQAKIEPEKLISIIEKGGVTLQEIMSRELTNAGQMVRRERDMSDVKTDWKTINDPATVKRARENYDKTIKAFNAIIKFQNDFIKPKIDDLDQGLAIVAQSAGIKRGTDKMGVENVPFANKTYNYTKQLMLALKVDAIADEVEKEINAGRHPVIALESTMESTIKDYAVGEVIKEPTFSASLLKGLDSVMQYTIKDENGKETSARYTPSDLGKAGEEAYYNLQNLIRESTSDIFISPLDAIIERLHAKGYKVGELTGRNLYVARNENGEFVVKRRTDKDKKKMQRDFNSGDLDVLILNKSASTGISLHASEKFKDQRQRTMIIAQPLSDINDYMQMIGRIDRTGQVHRGYYINLGLPVPAENRFLMMLSTKLKSLNANTTTSQDSKSNEVEAPDLLNKYGSQVVIEYLRDNPEVYEKMGAPLKKGGAGNGHVRASELDEYKPQDDDARKITGYVALLSTKEQEDFYNDVVKRYNDLIQYLNDTGSNDLKINVMPLRAKTLEKRVSSEGIDPNGTNPFAQNAYVEKVEMDVLRKPMKADEVKKTIDKLNKTNIDATSDVIRKESDAKIASENTRYDNAREKALDDIQKHKEKIERSKKLSDEEKVAAINSYITDTNNTIEERHDKNLKKITDNRDQLIRRLRMFDAGKSYLVPDNLESMTFDFASPAIFCGYKAKESKVTASTTLAVFATLDSRRRIEIKLSDINALQSIDKMTMDNIDAARSITLDNWDSQIPTETRKEGYILTGNILQAIADSQDEYGGYTGHLVSYTDIDGNIHDGILMPDKWNTSLLKNSGAPLSARMEQIKRYEPIVSSDGKVTLTGSQWADMYYLTVPKTKKDGAMYYENKVLLDSSKGVFYPYRGKLRADIPAKNIEGVVKELTKLGVKVRQSNDVVSEGSNINEEEANDLYREVTDEKLINKLENGPKIKVYRAMQLQDGKLLPPMSGKIKTIVKDKNGKERTKWVWREPTNIGKWEEAEERPDLANDDGTFTLNKGNNSINAAYNPYIHTSRSPINDQFSSAWNRDELVTVEVEVPESELSSGYHAEKAKNSVGEVEWKSGPVGNKLAKIGRPRLVILSRWDKPIRVIPVDEVAKEYAKKLEGTEIEVPFNTVTPELREALVKAGVKIGAPENNNAGKASLDAYNEWINNNEVERQGTGALTDSELSNANDPAGKMLGKPSRTPAQQRAFAERERQRMADRAREVADILHLDNVEIVTDASTLQGRRAKAKGFYSRDNGKIVIVVPNHVDMADIEQTVLHEAVAHYGLRKLFGSNFDTFLYNVYNNADMDVRDKIVKLAEGHNWDFATATEEYLASLAEKTNFENLNASWWDKIKSLFLKLLHSIGLKGFTGVSLSDNELRYILWRSYENLKNPGRYRSIIDEARDMSMQNDLKVGNYSVQNSRNNVAEGSDNVLYREAKEVEEEINNDWRDEYDKKLSTLSFKLTEAAQDAMRSVKILQDIIAKETSAPISDDENVYWRENRLSSVNKYEQEYYAENYFKPIVTAIANLVKYGARYNDKGKDIINSDNDILKYLIAKHGIERNNYFREREAMNARKPYENQIKELQKQVEKGEIKEEDANKKIAKLQEQADKAEMKKRVDVLHKDYSGLTELFQDKKDFDTLAASYVSDFEKKFDTEPLWNAINRATKGTLRKAFVDGLISKESYENTAKMYKYYIPLRGWANDVASEKYNYIGGKGHSSKILEISHGRTSLADNPISKIGQMMQDAILQGNRNRMKQAVYNLAINHDTSLLNIKRQWYQNMGTKDDPIWERVFPDLSSDMTAEQVAEEVEDFESRMRELKKEGKATQSRKGLILRLHTTKREEAQHRISVAINGKEYNIFVNGSPRAAQAINGELNDVDRYGSYISKINRFLAQVYTSINPEFVVTNYQRDAGFAASIVASTEPWSYQKEWVKNMTIYNPITTGVYLNRLIKKAKTGNINPNNKAERYMQEFLSNGGETGFTNMLSADDYKKQIKRDIKSINSVVSLPKAARAAVAFTERANTVFEDATRYATYVTSREQGRTIDRSIRDAKEISLNFNTRGADGLPGDGFIYRFFRGLRRWQIFVNPSIQGLNKAGMAFRNHPLRSSMMIAGLPTLLGYALPAIMQAVVGGGDGDDDDKNVVESYKDLPKWVRRTNIAIPIGGNNFITIPLSYELRVSYGLGEMIWEYGEGMIDKEEIASETLSQLSDLLPISFANGTIAQNVAPTFARPLVDIIQNRNFYGKKIYNDSQFIEGYPEYMKAYAGTPKWLVKSTEVLNNVIPNFDAGVSDKYTPGAINVNPAIIDYLLSSYLGGLYNFPSKFGKTISMIWDEDMRDIQNVPILSRNWKNSQSGNPYNSGDRYKTYMKEYDLSKQRFNGYKKEAKNDVPEFLNSLKDLLNTPSGKRMLMIDAYKRGGLDKLNQRIRDIDAYDNERYEGEKDTLTKKRDEVKEELINKLDSISEGTLDFVNGEWVRK